jgi:two-component system, NarL family, sensor histidine kinase DesK
MTQAGLMGRRPRNRRLGEDSGMSAFIVWKRTSVAAADQDPPAGGTALPAGDWPLPGSRTRKLLIGAAIGYFIFVPAITGIVQHVTPATAFIAAATVVFTGLVSWQVILRDRPGLNGVPWAWLAVLVALAIAVFAVGHGAAWVTILAVAAAACGRFTATIRPAAFGAISCAAASLIVTAEQAHVGAVNLALLIIVPPMSAYLAYAATKRNETVAELQRTRAELARAAVAGERLRIARDLHDLLGQSLSLITLKAELSRRMLDNDALSAAREMAELEAVARQSLSDVREAVAGYRQPDLAAELGAARQLLTAAGLSCQISTPAGLSLPAEVDTVLAWTVREGITNVVRHARATCAGVTVAAPDGAGRVVAEITDDGTGPLAGPAGLAGSGLAGLSERVRQLGGNLMAGPAPAGGFRLQVTIPVRGQ